MKLFAPRYKRYAAWPVVLWCRVRRHAGGGFFWSGGRARCVNCGDYVADLRMDADTYDEIQAEMAELRAEIERLRRESADYKADGMTARERAELDVLLSERQSAAVGRFPMECPICHGMGCPPVACCLYARISNSA